VTDWAESAYDDLLGRRAGARPYVAVNMVVSVDGAIAVDGRTAQLGGPADHRLFHHLRSLADVILVGAQTVRAERYGPPKLGADERAARRARGQEALPRLAIVSRSLDLDPEARVFGGGHRPLLIAPEDADGQRLDRLRAVADVVTVGEGTVDIATALDGLGAGLVLCEGGPTLNGELARADRLDELCLTVAGSFVGGAVRGVLGGGPLEAPLPLTLVSVRAREGDLFLRYRRTDRAEPDGFDGDGAAGATLDAFDDVMGGLDSPMMIVTVAHHGERSGCLVGFGSQASIHPGRFGVWVSKANHTHRLAMQADVLAVHFPSPGDRPLAELFGTTTGDRVDKFARCRWHDGPEGVPVLDDLTRWFAGRVVDRVDTGDHTLVVLAPIEAAAGPWSSQLGLQQVLDLEAGHSA